MKVGSCLLCDGTYFLAILVVYLNPPTITGSKGVARNTDDFTYSLF